MPLLSGEPAAETPARSSSPATPAAPQASPSQSTSTRPSDAGERTPPKEEVKAGKEDKQQEKKEDAQKKEEDKKAEDEKRKEEEQKKADKLKDDMKKLVWTKGDFKVVPYGTLWANTAWETSRTFPGNFTFYALSSEDNGEDAYYVDARSTRLGIDITGPRLWVCGACADTGGKVEFDFQGQALTENRGTVLLRHAYVEVKDDTYRLLAGQTWDVISPLYPGMLMYSVGWGGGNIGFRRPQFRAERFFAFSDTRLLTLQGSLNQSVFTPTDFPATDGVRGQPAGWPVVEGRVAMTLGQRGEGCQPIVFGVSSHFGEQLYDFSAPEPRNDVGRKTWSVNADVRIPITPRFGFQGEAFTGENLGPFLGGVIQGINPVTRETIRSTGGWAEVWYYWTCALHSHVGYGIDDPRDQDVPANGRTYNDFLFANIVWDLTKQFNIGVEFTSWDTHYRDLSPGESERFEFVVRYGF